MSLSATRETVDQKADRLVNTPGVVTWVHGICVIKGDHATYTVRRQNGEWTCDCPWKQHQPQSKACSHILAAALTAPAAQSAPTPTQPQTALPAKSLDQMLADLKTSLAASERPSHTVTPMVVPQTRLPRNVRRHQTFIRVDDPQELAALRQVANPSVRYADENGVQFAVCEQVVLDSALAIVGGYCR
ncbi:MAG TPA: SWIM zinc finger family protein [Candidatus Xenobia bacterium]|jgi:hypothetical protein